MPQTTILIHWTDSMFLIFRHLLLPLNCSTQPPTNDDYPVSYTPSAAMSCQITRSPCGPTTGSLGWVMTIWGKWNVWNWPGWGSYYWHWKLSPIWTTLHSAWGISCSTIYARLPVLSLSLSLSLPNRIFVPWFDTFKKHVPSRAMINDMRRSLW